MAAIAEFDKLFLPAKVTPEPSLFPEQETASY
jgi:hypothetical protein